MLRAASTSTRERLEEILAERIMVLDGSMGALIYAHELDEEDYPRRAVRATTRPTSRTAPRSWSSPSRR